MNITSTQKLAYKLPNLQREPIGSKPSHYFDQKAESGKGTVELSDPFQGGDHTVFASQPVRNGDGQVSYRDVQEEVDLTPRSPWTWGLGFGAGGAAVGAFAGLLTADAAGLSLGLGALGGAALLGGLAGGLGAHHVYGEKKEVVWDTQNLYQHRMTGFQEQVGVGEKEGEKGYFHRFLPRVKSTVVETYRTPRVVRFKDELPKELGEISTAWPQVSQQKEPATPNRQLDVTVSYEDSALQHRKLGAMPSDFHSYSSSPAPSGECGPEGCVTGDQSVVRATPVYEPNGDARVDATTIRIQESTSSVTGWAVGGAVGGGLAGTVIGLLGAAAGLNPAVSIGGTALLGAAGGAFLGARHAADDRVRLEWREAPIEEMKMTGYHDSVSSHYKEVCNSHYNYSQKKWEQKCERVHDGYDHDFRPEIDKWAVGTHIVPEIVHYSAKAEGETGQG